MPLSGLGMLSAAMTTRADLHSLIDELPDDHLDHVRNNIEALRALDQGDRLTKLLLEAPYDDEAYSVEERRRVDAARERYEAGEYVEWEDFKKSLRDE